MRKREKENGDAKIKVDEGERNSINYLKSLKKEDFYKLKERSGSKRRFIWLHLPLFLLNRMRHVWVVHVFPQKRHCTILHCDDVIQVLYWYVAYSVWTATQGKNIRSLSPMPSSKSPQKVSIVLWALIFLFNKYHLWPSHHNIMKMCIIKKNDVCFSHSEVESKRKARWA